MIHGRNPDAPCYFATLRRTYRNAFKALGICKLYDNHDWRATYGTQLKEANLSSAQVADLLGHADTRMVETIYAVTTHQGIMKRQNLINALNPYARGSGRALKRPIYKGSEKSRGSVMAPNGHFCQKMPNSMYNLVNAKKKNP